MTSLHYITGDEHLKKKKKVLGLGSTALAATVRSLRLGDSQHTHKKNTKKNKKLLYKSDSWRLKRCVFSVDLKVLTVAEFLTRWQRVPDRREKA